MSMEIYTAETDDINLHYYIGADEKLSPVNNQFPAIPLADEWIGFTFTTIKFNQETGKFDQAYVKPIAKVNDAELFEINTTTGLSFKVSPHQRVVCVNSDIFQDETVLDSYYDLSITDGLDESCSIIIKQDESYIIDGIKSINYIGRGKAYYILSSDESFVLANGLVLNNF